MVNTRQNQSSSPPAKAMPGRDNATEDNNISNHRLRDRSDKSGVDNDNDSECEPLISVRRSPWRRELRSRYSSETFGRHARVSRHPARACRMRMVAPRIDSDDDLSDPYIDDDEDEAIFSPTRKTRHGRRSRRISGSPARHAPPPPPAPTRVNSAKIPNGVIVKEEPEEDEEEDEDEEDNEGEAEADDIVVRRSKRQRKLMYHSFNQSWILGTQTVLRGYPDMYRTRGRGRERENADATSNSNDEGAPVELPSTQTTNEKADPDNQDEEDMYSKVKRTRRNRIRYSPSAELPPKRTRNGSRVAAGDDLSESESAASSDERTAPRRGQRRVYHLRQNKPMVDRFQVTNHEAPRRSSRLVLCPVRRRPFQRKRRESSSSDEERFQRKKALSLAKARSRCMPLNYKPSDLPAHQKTPVHSTKPVSGASGPKGPADVDPMTIDTSVTFEKVGGLEGHLRCLKEMVVFPMLYREVFEKFNVQPPKGVLFHGPPGTGKTLIARALANECSQGDRKVTFFMRKGADCLSKWVGESERQLRLLFEQAYQMRPSIIFFDEIDGLAPVRSSKQDQIHASIVSTLLALLDGLDDRGEIIVIGATNRIDTIDPALRRPGRFDRELYFPLPGKKERVEILKIHTKPWNSQPSTDVIDCLAEQSVGYCGSDLRLLCSEAVVGALRRRYPQIYRSSKKLLLQPEQVEVCDDDFHRAHTKIVPASCRVTACPRARLPPAVAPLLLTQYEAAVRCVSRIFPQATLGSTADTISKSVYKPRFLLCAPDGEYGQTTHTAPALLDFMEHIPVHILGLDTLLDTSNRSPEEAVIQILREASRNPPSVIYLPAIDTWWDLLAATTRRILLDRVAQIKVDAPVLLLGTSHCLYSQLDDQVKSIFKFDHQELRLPTEEERSRFFFPVLTEDPLKEPPPPPVPEDEWEVLPEAPPPKPPSPSKKELEELHDAEEQRLRQLRLFLREICSKLVRNRQFFMFTKPVDVKEVPDYLTIIQRPMDLETIMTNIDLKVYNSAQEFLNDVDLIVANALEYNPERDPEDKLIRHRACSLRDTTYALIKAEMDTDFEEECRKISKKRKEEKENKEIKTDNVSSQSTAKSDAPIVCNGVNGVSNLSVEEAKKRRLSAQGVKPLSSLSSAERIRKRKSTWAKGIMRKKAKVKIKSEEDSVPASGESTPKDHDGSGKHRASSPVEKESKRAKISPTSPSSAGIPNAESVETTKQSNGASSISVEETTPKKERKKSTTRRLDLCPQPGVTVDTDELKAVFRKLVSLSDGWTVTRLLDCLALLRREIENYSDRHDRENLPKDLDAIVHKLEADDEKTVFSE